ncbi:14485_t:CDS:2 [Acaulospora morrowiae]|uniref:14485_t:CDS:1 n=1 Tax=Acaulospora morrowiae TaxID=94023 RepID=A0A9N9BEL9_9GLOM|nr:14485_t:CDS:2 [Acaulospora morrowiae]
MQSNSQPVALYNKGLTGYWHDVCEEMKNSGWCIRLIESTQGTPGDITLPKPNITFLCFNDELWNSCESENDINEFIENLSNRIQRSIQRHHKAILLLHIENEDIQLLYEIQTRLLAFCVNINILPVHNPKETTTLLRIFYDGLLPENKPQIARHLDNVIHDKKMCDPTNLTSTNKWIHLVTQMSAGTRKLRVHDCYVLQEGLQTLYKMATATESQLLNCSLNTETAHDIFEKL